MERWCDGGSDLPRSRNSKVDTVPVAEQVRRKGVESGEEAPRAEKLEQEVKVDVSRAVLDAYLLGHWMMYGEARGYEPERQ